MTVFSTLDTIFRMCLKTDHFLFICQCFFFSLWPGNKNLNYKQKITNLHMCINCAQSSACLILKSNFILLCQYLTEGGKEAKKKTINYGWCLTLCCTWLFQFFLFVLTNANFVFSVSFPMRSFFGCLKICHVFASQILWLNIFRHKSRNWQLKRVCSSSHTHKTSSQAKKKKKKRNNLRTFTKLLMSLLSL